METYFGMLRQELLHRGGFVGRQIVQHDVDFFGPPGLGKQLTEKVDELGAGVPLRRITRAPAPPALPNAAGCPDDGLLNPPSPRVRTASSSGQSLGHWFSDLSQFRDNWSHRPEPR